MEEVIPLFKSHYSLGRSILTLDIPKEFTDDRSDTVFDIIDDITPEVKDVFLVEDSMAGFLEAYTNAKELKKKLIFGLRLTFCPFPEAPFHRLPASRPSPSPTRRRGVLLAGSDAASFSNFLLFSDFRSPFSFSQFKRTVITPLTHLAGLPRVPWPGGNARAPRGARREPEGEKRAVTSVTNGWQRSRK